MKHASGSHLDLPGRRRLRGSCQTLHWRSMPLWQDGIRKDAVTVSITRGGNRLTDKNQVGRICDHILELLLTARKTGVGLLNVAGQTASRNHHDPRLTVLPVHEGPKLLSFMPPSVRRCLLGMHHMAGSKRAALHRRQGERCRHTTLQLRPPEAAAAS